MDYSQTFVESSTGGYPISIFTENELNFVESKNLIEVKRDRFFPKFVGELITTENSYFSLPKNFDPTNENIELFKKVLERYKDLKGLDGKTLLTNNSFIVYSDGEIKSEKFYYNELKEFFLDYITYEFVYPKKTIKKHSTSPQRGKIDVLSTIRNRNQKGPGITYNIKDIINSDEWNLDDIYFTIVKDLQSKFGTDDDEKQINEITQNLEDDGYNLKLIDLSDFKKIIRDVEKCEVGIIHQPIKNTILDYLESKTIGENFKINAFYTLKFQYVWEEIVRTSLKHSDSFQTEFNEVFKDFPTKSVFISNIEGDDVMVDRKLYPDLFSEFDGKRFVGDAKYYKDPENSDFGKEMYAYNQAINNQYPMCVFVPSSNTTRVDVRRHGDFELIVFKISVKDAISDAVNNSDRIISKIQMLVSKNTRRKGNKTGFF